jgi:predicted metal-dependent hydrolase
MATMQYMLDLFGGLSAAWQGAMNSDKNEGAARNPSGEIAPKTVAIPLVPPSRDRFHHPRASRLTVLAGHEVTYAFQRARRRTIGFSVGPEGLAVRAPRWTPLAEVEEALQAKSGWIVRKLREMQERQQQVCDARIEWREGARLDYLGQPLTVALASDACVPAGGAALYGAGTTAAILRVHLPPAAPPAQIRDAVGHWLRTRAREVFIQRLDHFAPQIGVQWRTLGLSNAATRWGSATAKGAIRLNWRLIHFDPAVIDYVVVHELAHLRVMDHSPRFWAVVGSVLPGYAQTCRTLRRTPIPRWE